MTAPGRKDDAGKRRWHLLPWEAAGVVVDVLTWACTREEDPYPEENWRDVPDAYTRYYNALQRHVTDWLLYRTGRGGRACDEKSGLSNLAHASCCALFMLALEIKEKSQR